MKKLLERFLKRKTKLKGVFEEMKNNSVEDEVVKAVVVSMLILAIPYFMSAALLLEGFSWLSISMFGISLFATIYFVHEVKAPDYALLFKRGKLVGTLSPGWYPIFHLFWKVHIINMAQRTLKLKNVPMYTSEDTFIEADVTVFYQAKKANLLKIVYLLEPEDRIADTTLARLKKSAGIRKFSEIREHVTNIETEITKVLKKEMKFAWDITDVEISNLSEKIISEAAKIRKIGTAEAEIKRKTAEAFAEPLKYNYPAAIASAVSGFATSLERAVRDIFKQRTKSEKSESSGKTTIELDADSVNKIQELLGKVK